MSRRHHRSSHLPRSLDSHRRRFIKLYDQLCRSRQGWQVFSDFCELSALAIANGLDKNDERESRYLQIIGGYRELSERRAFPEMLACVADALEETLALRQADSEPAIPCREFLGPIFMELELSSHWRGQFFTPYPICELMARMSYTRDEIQRHLDADGFVKVLEPACGAGAMVVAFAHLMREYGFVPHRHMHVVAVDLDSTAAHMCYIQLSLLGVPAAVYVGNSLSDQMREAFYTPAHILGAWDLRLHARRLASAASAAAESTDANERTDSIAVVPDIAPPAEPDPTEFAIELKRPYQMDLFAA